LEKKLKIAFFVTNDVVTDQRMQRICATLQATSKWEVTLIGRKLKNSMPVENTAFKTKRLVLPFNKGKLFYASICVRYFLFGLFRKFDLICSIDADTIFPCHFLCKLKRAIHVHDAHELFTQVPELIGRKFEQRVWNKIEAIGFKSVKMFYTVSAGLAEYYSQHFEKGEIIRNLPYKKEIETTIEKQYDVIYQGAINKGRGILELIEASQIENFTVCIVGNGDIVNEVKARMSKCKQITYLEAIHPSLLHSITQQGKIGFNALENSSKSYDESLPNKTFDYMMAGIPQIISNSKALIQLNKELEIALVCNLNAKDIAEKIRILLDDKVLYKQLQINAIKASETYNWEHESKKLKAIYKKFEI